MTFPFESVFGYHPFDSHSTSFSIHPLSPKLFSPVFSLFPHIVLLGDKVGTSHMESLLAGSGKRFIFIFLLFENTGQLRKYKCAGEVNLP